MARDRMLNIRVSKEELTRIEAAARRISPSLKASAWGRDVLLAAATGKGRCARCGCPAEEHDEHGCRHGRCACRRFTLEEDAG